MGLRRKYIGVADQAWPFFVGVKSRPTRIVEDALPEDAKFVGIEHDLLTRITRIVFESDDFDEVPEGMPYPELRPVFWQVPEPEPSLN